MAFGRKEITALVFLVIEFQVIDSGQGKQLVTLIHLDTERVKDHLRIAGFLDNGMLTLILIIGCCRHDSKIMLQELIIGCKLDHLRINEDKLEFRRMFGVEK